MTGRLALTVLTLVGAAYEVEEGCVLVLFIVVGASVGASVRGSVARGVMVLLVVVGVVVLVVVVGVVVVGMVVGSTVIVVGGNAGVFAGRKISTGSGTRIISSKCSSSEVKVHSLQ